MFRHYGKSRTFIHNLRIASLLSFVAGMVNTAGFFSVKQLTTNVTGHFAFMMDDVFTANWLQAAVYFLYILFFFLGSFVSNLLIELIARKSDRYMYVAPVLTESLILFTLGIAGSALVTNHPHIIACGLLFAMGLQNSLVTTISSSVVRTTHLTGLFTDLGIDLSQLYFYKTSDQQRKLHASIRLRLTIIGCFFCGGIFGGVLFSKTGLKTLDAAGALLTGGLIYDYVKFTIIRVRRKFSNE